MATLNTNYGNHAASSAYARNAATAIEKSLTSEWKMIVAQVHPFWAALIGGGRGNVNKGFTVSGQKALIPVILETAYIDGGTNPAFAGVADADQLNTFGNNTTNGLTQAEFEYTHYRGNITILNHEIEILQNNPRNARVLDAKKKQFIETMKQVISGHLGSDTAGGRTKVMGYQFPINSNVVVGGIDQAGTGNELWQGNRVNVGGPLLLSHIDDRIDTVAKYGGKPDFGFCSYASGATNVFGAMRSLLQPGDQLKNENFSAKYGFNNIVYSDITMIQDHWMTVTSTEGRMAILDTSAYYASIPTKPKMHPLERLQGTDSYEQFHTLWAMVAIDNPRLQSLLTGITG